MTNNAFSAGYSEAVITPPLGLNIPGYYGDRLATGKINDLMLRAVALQSGTTKAVLFSCDCISIRNAGYYLLRKKIAERCQIPEETVYIACNHSHTSFRICAPDQAYSEDFATYLSRLVQIFCDCAQFAFQDLKPAALRIGKGEAKGVGFIRRCIMKNGTLKTNPPIGSPEIDRYASEHDDSLQLIRIDRESAKNILLINFGTHSDTIGGNLYCSDYSGYLIENLKGAFGGNIEAVFFNGAEGDSNHRNVFLPKDAPMKGIPVAKRMARILAGEVLKIYDDATEAKSGEIRASVQVLPIRKNLYEPEDVPTAEEMYRIYLEKGKSAPELKQYPLILSTAVRIAETKDLPDYFQMPISALRFGDIAFAGIPGEPFQKIGMDIKATSPAAITFVTSCTNGGEENAYYPTKEAYDANGYENSASIFAPGCAEKMIDGVISLLKSI